MREDTQHTLQTWTSTAHSFHRCEAGPLGQRLTHMLQAQLGLQWCLLHSLWRWLLAVHSAFVSSLT
jgi:hypothetical protein